LCGAEGRGLTIGQQSPHKTERGAFSFVSLYTLDCLPIKNTHKDFASNRNRSRWEARLYFEKKKNY
jgi:hypothetical protein